MNRNLKFIATAMMMVVTLSAFANIDKVPAKYTSSTVVSSYLDASAFDKQNQIKNMLAEDFEYINMQSGSKASKKAYMKFLEDTNALNYNCESTYEVLDQSGKAAVAKATFKFENFTRVDILNLKETKDGWKITKVITNFL